MQLSKFKIISILLVFLSFILVDNCFAANSMNLKKPLPQYKSYELLVKFNEGTSQAEKSSGRKVVKAKLIKKIKSIDVEIWKLPDENTVEDAINALTVIPSIKYVEPNYLYRPQVLPNDTNFNQQWYLRNTGQTVNTLTGTPNADISVIDAWDIETGSPDIIIAVIDSGHPIFHPDFLDNTWVNTVENSNGFNFTDDDGNGYIDDLNGWDFANNSPFVHDYSRRYDGSGGHGGHVSGIIAAQGNNGTGTTGVMWDAQIMPIKVFDDFSTVINSPPSASILIEAIQYAITNGAKIINLSLTADNYSQSLYDITSLANDNNMLVVAAAGNASANNDTSPVYPANYNLPNIISVAATNENDELAAYSNYGQNTVHVGAPGGGAATQNIYSTLPPPRVTIFSEDFESGGSQWNTNSVYQSWGITYDSIWGSNVVIDSPTNYFDSESSYITTNNKISIPNGCLGVHTFYQIEYDLEYLYDFAYVQISSDGTNYDTVESFTGSSNGIITKQEYLPFLEENSSFYLRFGLLSDTLNNYDGVYLDNLLISCVPWTYNGSEYGYMSGTSMAAPVVAGIAGLVWSKYPELTHLEVKDAILNSADALDSLASKVSTGGRVNAASALLAATPTTTSTYTTTTTTVPAATGGGGGGGGGGIFGDIMKSSVIGYHLDGFTTKGVQVYMPVTLGFKALKGTQEYVRSFAPNLAEFVRRCFDFFEQKADTNKEGFLYKIGTHLFPILGEIAEKSLGLIGEEEFIDEAYSDTTISIEEFNKLKRNGLAIAPKIVKDPTTLKDNPKQERSLTDLVY